jgi:hypothetical protein
MKQNLSIKYFGAVVISLAMITAASSVIGQAQNHETSKYDAAPVLLAERVTPSAPAMDPGDVLFEYHLENETGDNQMLGVEFDGTYFWATEAVAARIQINYINLIPQETCLRPMTNQDTPQDGAGEIWFSMERISMHLSIALSTKSILQPVTTLEQVYLDQKTQIEP